MQPKWRRMGLTGAGLLLLGVAAWLGWWYAGSPVGSGLYPARLGGTFYETDPDRADFDLPVIWVRPHPWAKAPPEFHFAQFVGESGDGPSISGNFRARLDWDDPSEPVWMRERAVRGYVDLDFPKAGMTVTGVRWQVAGEPMRLFQTGPARLETAPDHRPPAPTFAARLWQLAYPPVTHPGQKPDYSGFEGQYFYLEGKGQLLDLIPSLVGMEHPISGLRYRPGVSATWPSGLVRRYYEDPDFQPLTFPLDIEGGVTIYIPLSEEAKARWKDTYSILTPVGLFAGPDGKPESIVPFSGGVAGINFKRTRWRYWAPYFVYTSEIESPGS